MTTDPASATRTGTAARPAPGQTMPDPRRFNVRGWLLWTVGFVSFPIAGLPLGTVQAFLLRDRVARSWVRAAAMPLPRVLGWTITAAAPSPQDGPPTATA